MSHLNGGDIICLASWNRVLASRTRDTSDPTASEVIPQEKAMSNDEQKRRDDASQIAREREAQDRAYQNAGGASQQEAARQEAARRDAAK